MLLPPLAGRDDRPRLTQRKPDSGSAWGQNGGHRATDVALDVEPHAAALDQQRAQTHSGTPQARLGGGERQAIAIGVFVLPPAFEVAAAQHVLVGGIQLGKAALDAIGQGVDGRRFGRNRRLQIGIHRFGRTLPPDIVDQGVACDLEQPGARLLEFAEPLALPHRLEKDLLQEVVGSVRVPQLVTQEPQQLRFMGMPGLQNAAENNTFA